MNNILLTALIVLGISGCSCDPVIVKVPVYKMPEFTMPTRPILNSASAVQDQFDTRPIETDLLDLEKYAIQLENILNSLKSKDYSSANK